MKFIKLFAPLSLLVLILVLFSACDFGGAKSDLKKERFYRKILFDGSYKIIGRYPVNSEKAANLNCYHLKYNDDGQLVMFEFLKRGQEARDLIFGIHKATFEYGPNLETRRYFNINGTPMTNFQGVFSTRFSLNDQGQYMGKDNYDVRQIPTADRNGVYRYEWEIDENGRRLASVSFDMNGDVISDSVSGIYEVRWSYDNKGRRSTQSYHKKDGSVAADQSGLAIIRFEYFPSDEVSAQIYIGLDDDGGEVFKTESRAVWDQYGNSIEHSQYDSNHLLTRRYLLAYDDFGNTVSQKRYGINDSLEKIINWQFDSLGTMIHTIVRDGEGNILSER